MNKPKPIKPFKTLEEEAKFWDTHDLSPLVERKRVDIANLPLIEKEKESSITLRVQKTIKDKLNKIARSKGLNSSTLARMWLIERLQSIR